MNQVLDYLYLRRLKFNYICPPVCPIVPASGSGLAITGQIISPLTPLPQAGDIGGFLTFGPFPGGLCYGIYQETGGVFTPIAQCVQPHTFITCCPGCYKFSTLTAAGESALSAPVCGDGSALITLDLPSDPSILGYNIYREADPLNPSGNYALILSGDFFNVFLACAPGCYSFTAITADGETPFSQPFCIPSGGCNACTLLNGLLAYWKMDELAGQPRSDATGNGWTAQNFGRTPVGQGIFNLALRDVLTSPQGLFVNPGFDARPSSQPFTYQLWYQFSSFRSGNTIAGEWGGGTNDWRLTTAPVGGFQWQACDDSGNVFSIQDSTVLTPGQWYHILLIWDGVKMRLYVNGVNTATSGAGNLAPNGSPTGIRRAHNSFWFDNDASLIQQPSGLFDESGYWNRVLIPAEIAKLYNNGVGLQYPFCSTPPTPPPPTLLTGIRAYWKMDEPSGQDRADATGNGFTAVHTGACPATAGIIGMALQDPLAFAQALTVSPTIDTNPATSPFSFQLWYQFELDRSDNTVAGEWGGGTNDWRITYHATGPGIITWNFFAFDTLGNPFVAAAHGFPGTSGLWTHIVAVWDGANMNLYINGALAAQAPGAPTNVRRGDNALIFDNDASGIQQPSGNFDEAAYWARALSANEVSQLYNGGLALAYPFH